jgi:hypothetical protein
VSVTARIVTGLVVAGLLASFAVVGLDTADKVASGICAVLAVVALAAQHLVPRRATRASATGTGAVAIGGDNGADVSTTFTGPAPPGVPEPAAGAAGASGAASVAVGGSSTAAIRTDVHLWP